jgi:hypothetical protein
LRRYGESKAHEAAKIRIGEILSAQGWKVYVDSYSFECETAKGPRTYWPDVYAESPEYQTMGSAQYYQTKRLGAAALQRRGRRIIVEIQGKGGHNTKLAFNSDRLRIQDIWESHGFDIEYYDLTVRKKGSVLDIRNWSDQDIREELGLDSS